MLQLAKEAQENGDNEKAAKLVETYDAPLAAIEQTFSASGAADSSQIIAIYTKKFDAYKSDINKLNSAINLMAVNDCDDTDIYYLTAGNTLMHTWNPRTLNACRAYFQFSENIVNDVREFILNFGDDTLGIDDAAANSSLFTLHSSLNEGWYDLNGRKLDGKPAKKGVYIQNGYKVVIK